MINIGEVIETNDMVEKENLDVAFNQTNVELK